MGLQTAIQEPGCRGLDALFRTMIGGELGMNLLWLDSIVRTLGWRLMRTSVMRSCGWEHMHLGLLLLWGRMGRRVSRVGLRTTQLCLEIRCLTSGTLISLSCSRYFTCLLVIIFLIPRVDV